jgi:hypothetical protein
MKEQAQNVALRLVGLSAAMPIFWLRKELSPQPLGVFLTLALYAVPCIAIAVCPPKSERFQIGIGVGYPPFYDSRLGDLSARQAGV